MDLAADFSDLSLACVRLHRIAALPPAESLLRRPEVSGWSALEHVAHVALANELIVRNLESLVSGKGALVQLHGEPIDGALAMLESGVIPRGRAQSPRMVRPPAKIDPALLAEWLATADAGFASFAQRTGELALAQGRIPHQLLGPLTAVRWVRFATVHSRHHLAIADAVLRH